MCKYICMDRIKNENTSAALSNLQTNYSIKLDFQKVDQHTDDKC